MDYRNPDITAILVERTGRLRKFRSDPRLLAGAKIHYKSHPWDYVRDWGMTFDPRALERGNVPHIPFLPWEKQEEYLRWLYGMWQAGERGLVEKSRDCGVTWLSVGFAVAMWATHDGFVAGFGSRKEELVDRRGDDKSIFEKLRYFIDNVPADFLPDGFDPKKHSSHMRIVAPHTGSAIIGEAGDDIGRGGRASIYLVDEAAFIERQDKVDAALSQNTNCQIDISTPNGTGNAFYKKRQRLNGTDRLFVFDWRDDPRKDSDWYAKQRAELDEVIVAQEIDRDYAASADDVFIPAKWVSAAIDAHKRLGFEPEGIRATGFDPADVGDAKAAVTRWGSVIIEADALRGGDITQAIPWAMKQADDLRADVFGYDADGMGAPAMKLSLVGKSGGRTKVRPYRGSAAVEDPDRKYRAGDKTNTDTFYNFRAQSWTWLRDRFEATYNAVQRAEKGLLVNADPEDLISISTECAHWQALQAELSRPRRVWSANGKIQVERKDKMKARGVDSPNLADALVIAFSMRVPAQEQHAPVRVVERSMRDRMVGY